MPRTDSPNDESNWRRRLAGETDVDTHPDTPDYGFYRVRERKGGPFVPITYWYNDKGDLRCKLNGKPVDDLRAREIWPFASENPVEHEIYQSVVNGARWPDIDDTVADQVARNPREHVGGNNPPQDPAVDLKLQIENAEIAVAGYADIKDDDTAARAQSLRSRLLELKGAAEKTHETEKAPHWAMCKAIDNKWLPLARMAEAGAKAIKRALDAFEDVKLKKRRRAEAEAQRRAEDEQRARAQALREARVDAGEVPPPPQDEPAPPIAPVTPPPPPPPIKGAYGRAAHVGTKKVAIIMDIDKVFAVFRDRIEVGTLLQKLSQRAVDDGHAVDGVDIEEKADVR